MVLIQLLPEIPSNRPIVKDIVMVFGPERKVNNLPLPAKNMKTCISKWKKLQYFSLLSWENKEEIYFQYPPLNLFIQEKTKHFPPWPVSLGG